MFSISSVQTLILKQPARRRAVLVPKVPDYQFFLAGFPRTQFICQMWLFTLFYPTSPATPSCSGDCKAWDLLLAIGTISLQRRPLVRQKALLQRQGDIRQCRIMSHATGPRLSPTGLKRWRCGLSWVLCVCVCLVLRSGLAISGSLVGPADVH